MSDPTSPESAAAPKKSSKKKMAVIALAGVMLAGGSAASAFWYANSKGPSAQDAQPQPKPLPKANFSNLEPFTVNLQDPRGERFAQVGITLELTDAKSEAEIKDRLPAIRNNILMLLSSKQIEELLSAEGKQQLALEIRDQAGQALGFPPEPPAAAASNAASAPAPAQTGKNARHNPIRAVLFSQFIVQ